MTIYLLRHWKRVNVWAKKNTQSVKTFHNWTRFFETLMDEKAAFNYEKNENVTGYTIKSFGTWHK